MAAWFVLAIFCLTASQGWAGTITIQIRPEVDLRGSELHAHVTVTNEGDEAAHGVTPTLRFQGSEARAATQGSLEPGHPMEASLLVAAHSLAEGRWPYEIAVDYADANLYPFQALAVGMVVVGSPPLPKVSFVELESATLSGESELSVPVKNLSESRQRIRLRVLAPEAIEAPQDLGEIELGPWEAREVPVALTNHAALPGSRYPLFVTLEYDDGTVHQTVIGQTSVEIRPVDAWMGSRGRYLWFVAAVFGVVFAGLVIFRLVRG